MVQHQRRKCPIWVLENPKLIIYMSSHIAVIPTSPATLGAPTSFSAKCGSVAK